jgi:protein-tyrosine phosphatase
VIETAAAIRAHLAAGRGVAVHCYAGLGRSPLLAAMVLIDHGLDATEAIARVSRARGAAVPEMPEQHTWLADYARLHRPS